MHVRTSGWCNDAMDAWVRGCKYGDVLHEKKNQACCDRSLQVTALVIRNQECCEIPLQGISLKISML